MRKQETARYAPMFEIAIVDLSDPDFDMGRYSIEAQALFSTMRLIRELANRDTLRWLLREKVRPAWRESELGARLKEEIVWYSIEAPATTKPTRAHGCARYPKHAVLGIGPTANLLRSGAVSKQTRRSVCANKR